MASIRCAGCGANNQDVAETDPCWKCGRPLQSAPPVAERENNADAAPPQALSSTAAQATSPVSEAVPASRPVTLAAPPPTPPGGSEQLEIQSTARRLRIMVFCIALAIVLILVLYALFFRPHA